MAEFAAIPAESDFLSAASRASAGVPLNQGANLAIDLVVIQQTALNSNWGGDFSHGRLS